MSRIFRKRRPVPVGAVIISKHRQRVAQWTDARGRKHEAEVVVVRRDGKDCEMVELGVWSMRYRDAAGIVRERSTGCRTREGALRVLADVEARGERVRAGVLSADDAHIAEHAGAGIEQHMADYLENLRNRGCCLKHVKERGRTLARVVRECRFNRLRDLDGVVFARWLAARAADGMGARTRNTHRAAVNAFGNWLAAERRIVANPFERVEAANERVDRRRTRRVLTVAEVDRLCEAARTRPLRAAGGLIPARRQHLTNMGEQRALLYRLLVSTGLRYGEARSLRCSQIVLDVDPPHIVLKAQHEKARRGARLPLPAALVDELALHIARRTSHVVGRPGAFNVVSFETPGEDPPLFDLPTTLTHVFTLDVKAAGIPKRDAQGRTVDVHSLRHTFCTWLAKSGVSIQIAQRLMRHSDPKLTTQFYTHLDLGDLAAGVAALPSVGERVNQVAAQSGGDKVPLKVPLMDGKTCLSGHGLTQSRPHNENSGCLPSCDQKAPHLRENKGLSDGSAGEKASRVSISVSPKTTALRAGAAPRSRVRSDSATRRGATPCPGYCRRRPDAASSPGGPRRRTCA